MMSVCFEELVCVDLRTNFVFNIELTINCCYIVRLVVNSKDIWRSEERQKQIKLMQMQFLGFTDSQFLLDVYHYNLLASICKSYSHEKAILNKKNNISI